MELGNEQMESYSNTIVAPAVAPLATSVAGSYRNVALNDPQPLKTQFGGISEEINWRFAPDLNLKSITAFRDSIYKFQNDNDATELELQDLHIREADRQYSQEINLQYVSPRLTGVAGLYYFHDEDHESVGVDVPSSVITPPARALFNGAEPQIDTNSGAIFAQATYNVTSQLSLVAGARYTGETKSFHTSSTDSRSIQRPRGRLFRGLLHRSRSATTTMHSRRRAASTSS